MSYNLSPPPPPEQIFKDVYYFGGHSAYPEKHSGQLTLTTHWLIFQEMTGLIKKNPGAFRLEIPINKITNTSIMNHSEISRATSIIAGPLWGVGLPVKQKFVVIQYSDQNGIIQNPLFDFITDWGDKDKGKLTRALYEYTKNNQIQPATEAGPLHQLKLRLAMGEISREEFEETKKLLQS